MRAPTLPWLLLFLALPSVGAQQPAASTDGGPFAGPADLKALEWREIGPYRGGRCAAVCGIPGDRQTYYFGATGGGVWKTDDAGRTWRSVSDGYFGGSIGAVAVSEWDPNVVYVGTGEKTVRGNVSHGDGVWKSTDAGRTWRHVGLADSRHVCRIRIHPRDPDVVYAAALGHLAGPNDERGVYRSRDGGVSWERVLSAGPDAGAVDLVLDPTNPRILYATTWRVRRSPWELASGGEGSGVWKSTDSGDTWTELTRNDGLPAGTIGICGIAVSPTDSDNLYAIVEAEEGGVFRSRDAGKTWTRTSADRSLRQRAWYYSRLYADPADADVVYALNVGFHRSQDGGRTFRAISTPHGDNHDLWIDPLDATRMIEGNDGGACVSEDRGATWTPQDNQPTAQIYRLSTDTDFPYRILGAQQDNSALRIRSRSLESGSIGLRDWEPTAGGESGHIVARPDDPDVVFGGSYGGYLTRHDHRTGETRAVDVWPDNPMGWGAASLRYRFQWNFPLFFSPNQPRRLYAAANVLFQSDDEGLTWAKISPDLTRNDKAKQGPSGGPITKDNTSVEYYATIFAACESSHRAGVLWTGSDDGLVHVSRDGGGSWLDVTPAGLPEWSQVNSIEPHPFVPGGLYLAATRYQLDDLQPLLFVTEDWGATWRRIDGGLPRGEFTRVIRADPDRAGLLYAGTERGVWFSLDDGVRWQRLEGGLPIVPITDLAVKQRDLVAATQGRGFWVLDHLEVLHQWEPSADARPVQLFEPRPTWCLSSRRSPAPRGAGTNPEAGVVFHYRLRDEPAPDAPLRLELIDDQGTVIRTFTRKPAKGETDERGDDEEPHEDLRLLDASPGLNRFVWNLRHGAAERFPKMILWNGGGLTGPRAIPGRYAARLVVGTTSETVPFDLLPDPRSRATPEDREAQLDFLVGIRDQLSRVHRAVARVGRVRSELARLTDLAKERPGAGDLAAKAQALSRSLTEIEEALYQTRNRSRQDPLNFPIRLGDKLAGVAAVAARGEGRPTRACYEVRDRLVGEFEPWLERLDLLLTTDLQALDAAARQAGIPIVVER